MMTDFALDVTTHDIAIRAGDFIPIDGLAAIEQELRIALLSWRGEWFLDRSVGTDHLGRILGRSSQVVRDAEIKSVIMSVPGVVEILSYVTRVDRLSRSMEVVFTVLTSFGELESSLPLGKVTRITSPIPEPPPIVVPPEEVDLYSEMITPLELSDFYAPDAHPSLGGGPYMSVPFDLLDYYEAKPHAVALNDTPEP